MSTNTLRTLLVTLLKLSDSIMKTVLETMGTLKGCDVVDVTTDHGISLYYYRVLQSRLLSIANFNIQLNSSKLYSIARICANN